MFKECQRCSGNLLVEEDIETRLEGFVCLQCGHRQAIQVAQAATNTEDQISAMHWLMSPRLSKVPALHRDLNSSASRRRDR